MFDFDPRDCDRQDARDARDADSHDRDHDDVLTLGRGPASNKLDDHHDDPRHRVDDWREARDRDGQDRNVGDRDSLDPRDVFVRDLNLPRGRERERVLDRDLRESRNASSDGRNTDLWNLRATRVWFGRCLSMNTTARLS